MTKNFTLNDLIRFIYKETSTNETLAIEDALKYDFEFQEEYKNLLDATSNLPKVFFKPSQDSLSQILKHSRKSSLLAHY